MSACVAGGYGRGQDRPGHGPPCIVDNLVTVMTLLQGVIRVKTAEPWRWDGRESVFDYMVRLHGVVGNINCFYWHHARVFVLEITCGTGQGYKVRKEIPVERIEYGNNTDEMLCVALEQAVFEIKKMDRRESQVRW